MSKHAASRRVQKQFLGKTASASGAVTLQKASNPPEGRKETGQARWWNSRLLQISDFSDGVRQGTAKTKIIQRSPTDYPPEGGASDLAKGKKKPGFFFSKKKKKNKVTKKKPNSRNQGLTGRGD